MKMGGKRKVVETIEEGNGEEEEEGVEERKNKWRIKKNEKSSRIGEQNWIKFRAFLFCFRQTASGDFLPPLFIKMFLQVT